jgi:hypothetical protein
VIAICEVSTCLSGIGSIIIDILYMLKGEDSFGENVERIVEKLIGNDTHLNSS